MYLHRFAQGMPVFPRAVSDIPDWCYVEAWGTQEGKQRAGARPTAEDVQRFWQVSPIAHVDKASRRVGRALGWVCGARAAAGRFHPSRMWTRQAARLLLVAFAWVV